MTLEQLILDVAEAIRPPERISVTEAGERYHWIHAPGAYSGYYNREMTPYMTEPGEILTSFDYKAMIFVGPAQSGKTNLFFNWLIYSAMCDPADLMLVDKSQSAARDFSVRRIARLTRYCEAYARTILPGRHNQNTFDVRYRSGMLLSLSHPSVNELSGKPIPRVWLTDYDRMPDDIDGEGSPFDLAAKRTTTFRRFAMAVAESSPSRPVTNPRWMPSTPHEGPPVGGIIGLYNRGDRRRWYWSCVSCQHEFEPTFGLLRWPKSKDPMESAEQAYMACPSCGQVYVHGGDEKTGVPGKRVLNNRGRWKADPGVRSEIASFWIKGPAAEFTTWKDLVLKYLRAKQELETTGSEESLKSVVNTDLGEAYTPVAVSSSLLPEELMKHRRPIGEHVVPEGVRFLLATVDVQRSSFQVMVTGFKADRDVVVIDRFAVRKSERLDNDGDPFPVAPGAHPEDWDLLVEQVIRKQYVLPDGRFMSIRAVGIDSGGKEGVTTNAIVFWRRLRDEHGESGRVYLLKGDGTRSAPRVEVTYPDAANKNRNSGARGDVPFLIIASNPMKDTLSNALMREEPGGGFIEFADWLPDTFYQELTAEVRNEKGKWDNPRRVRNESWDLLYYALSLSISPLVNIERIDWSAPPPWAESWDRNSLVGVKKEVASQPKVAYDLGRLAENFG